MTIAQKSGALIVKDGRIASNCNCCGGWYCCPPQWKCNNWASQFTIQVNIQASDFVRFTQWQSDPNVDFLPQRYGLATDIMPMATIFSGSHSLTLESVSANFATFAKNINGGSSSCVGGRISANVYADARNPFDPSSTTPSESNRKYIVRNIFVTAPWLLNVLSGCGTIPGGSQPKTYEYISSQLYGDPECDAFKPDVYCNGWYAGIEEQNKRNSLTPLGVPDIYIPDCATSHTTSQAFTRTQSDLSVSTLSLFGSQYSRTSTTTGSLTFTCTTTVTYTRA